MGRTKRFRQKRSRNKQRPTDLSTDQTTINLLKWMHSHQWTNSSKLLLKQFPNTGRGVTSSSSLTAGDTLIEVPLHLMISTHTMERCAQFVSLLTLPAHANFEPLTLHDTLALFLQFQRHRGRKSFWHKYVETLPTDKDLPQLPQFLDGHVIDGLPSTMMRRVKKQQDEYLASLNRVIRVSPVQVKLLAQTSPTWRCDCCGQHADRVFTGHDANAASSYRWAYIMVNTRAVYINPTVIAPLSNRQLDRILQFIDGDSDSESSNRSMALCPFLDMFNHSDHAATDAITKSHSKSNLTFRLVTLVPLRAHEQFFISYGSHDNRSLICEYGFFIPGNQLDVVRFSKTEVMTTLLAPRRNVNREQYKYLQSLPAGDNDDDDYYHVAIDHVSHHLRQLIYVLLEGDAGVARWNTVTHGALYTDGDLRNCRRVVRELMTQVGVRRSILVVAGGVELPSLESSRTQLGDSLSSYLTYQLEFWRKCYESFSCDL